MENKLPDIEYETIGLGSIEASVLAIERLTLSFLEQSDYAGERINAGASELCVNPPTTQSGVAVILERGFYDDWNEEYTGHKLYMRKHTGNLGNSGRIMDYTLERIRTIRPASIHEIEDITDDRLLLRQFLDETQMILKQAGAKLNVVGNRMNRIR